MPTKSELETLVEKLTADLENRNLELEELTNEIDKEPIDTSNEEIALLKKELEELKGSQTIHTPSKPSGTKSFKIVIRKKPAKSNLRSGTIIRNVRDETDAIRTWYMKNKVKETCVFSLSAVPV